MPTFVIPSKVLSYLRRLLLNYEHSGFNELAAIIKHARIAIDPDTDRYHDFGADHYGHNIVLFLPPEAIAPISLNHQAALSERLKDDLMKCCANVALEYIHDVRMELEDEDDFLFQSSHSISDKPPINPDNIPFWNPGQIRLFISHRDTHKLEAKDLAQSLEEYGISCFVAHDTIEPLESWKHEIEKGLQTMEFMLALITEDFRESVWTNQEVGYALGSGVPVISLRAGARDPEGFIADKQALKGSLANIAESAPAVYQLLADKLKQKERLQTALITSFLESPSWDDTKIRFNRLDGIAKSLTEEEFARIKEGYAANHELHQAMFLHSKNRLRHFIFRTTGKNIQLDKGKIIELVPHEAEEEVPF